MREILIIAMILKSGLTPELSDSGTKRPDCG